MKNESRWDDQGNETFPIRLKKLRERKHLKRSVASELCGLTRDAFGRYETGQRVPSIYRAADIADFFGVTLDYLILGKCE